MALDEAGLASALQTVLENTANTPATAASGMASAIVACIKTGTVTVAVGITLTTPDTINGATTGTGTGTIS